MSLTPLAPLLKLGHTRVYPEGQIIIYKEDTPADVYLLQNGEVKVTEIDEDGNEKILTILRAPTLFPMLFHLEGQSDVPFFYTALTDAEVCTVSHKDFNEAIQTNNDIALYVLRRVYLEVHELRVRIASLSKTDTYTKLLAALKFLAKYHTKAKAGNWQQVIFPVSHQFLADMIGVTRESTTLAMGKIQTEKLVRFPRRGVMEINSAKLFKA